MGTSHQPMDAMCVRVSWGEQLVTSQVLRGAAEVRDGALSFAASPPSVRFREGAVGELLRNGQTPLSLSDAVALGLAAETPDGWVLELGRADVVRLTVGALTWEAARLAPPRRVPFRFEPDYRFLNTLLLCFALFGGMAMRAQFLEDEGWSDEPTHAAAHFSKALVHAVTTPPPPKQQPPVTVTERPVKTRGEAVRSAAGAPAPLKSRTSREAGVGRPASLLASQIFSGPGLGELSANGGLGKSLEGALGQVTAATGDGLGGLRLKGDGLGGGGGARATIGSLGVPHGPIGETVGALRGKDTPDLPKWAPTEPLCDGPCMDKELIRKIIHEHVGQIRACYELALQSAPSTSGKVVVSFFVGQSGAVAASEVRQNDTRSDELAGCLARRVRAWQFPVAKGDSGYRVTYPFLFKPVN